MTLHHDSAHAGVPRLARGADGVESARHSKVISRGHVRAEMNMHVNGAVHHVIDYRAEIFLRQHKINPFVSALYNNFSRTSKHLYAGW
jgi:hypothetical protein